MELKYKNALVWKFIGVMWLISSFINLQLYIYSNGELSRLRLLTAVLNLILGIYFLVIDNINYIIIADETLIIRTSLIEKRKIKLKNIEKGEYKNSDIILYPNKGRKVKIRHDLLSSEDFFKVEQELENLSLL